MAQANAEDEIDSKSKSSKEGGFRLNAHAPEFIPTSHQIFQYNNNNDEMAMSSYFYLDGTMGSGTVSTADWCYVNATNTSVVDQTCHSPSSSFFPHSHSHSTPNFQVLQLKIIKQVEYLFSDLSLLANDTMVKHVSKDPQGYVSISVIASMKKIKVLITDHHLLVEALRSSTKLIVSKDGKKVKRRTPFTENYKEDLQGRTLIVENLPEDHSYQNLEKIFSVVGSVKAIRLCHPPDLNPYRSKNEIILSNKLHALVEYENSEMADRAVESLNDQKDWRNGMRVRVMLRQSPKSVLKGSKIDFDITTDDDEAELVEATSQLNGGDCFSDNITEDDCGGSGKAPVRGRGKTKTRLHCQTGRGLLTSSVKSIGSPFHLQCETSLKSINKGPKTPDGSKGFTMGRGKPLRTCSAPISPNY